MTMEQFNGLDTSEERAVILNQEATDTELTWQDNNSQDMHDFFEMMSKNNLTNFEGFFASVSKDLTELAQTTSEFATGLLKSFACIASEGNDAPDAFANTELNQGGPFQIITSRDLEPTHKDASSNTVTSANAHSSLKLKQNKSTNKKHKMKG